MEIKEMERLYFFNNGNASVELIQFYKYLYISYLIFYKK